MTEHPDRTVGFVTVADNVATGLAERGWPVTVVGVYADGAPGSDGRWPYPLRPVSNHLAAADVLGEVQSSTDARPIVLLFGRNLEVAAFERRLDALGTRHRFDVRYYLPADFAPLPLGLARDLERLDQVIPATQPAATLLAGHATTTDPIPHGVDTATFIPPSSLERAEFRRRRVGLDERTSLVSTFSRNSGNKRLDLAARVMATLAHGRYRICANCLRHLVAPIRTQDGRLGAPPTICDRCGSDRTRTTEPRPLVWQLHTEDVGAEGRRASRGHDIDRLVKRYDLSEIIWWQRGMDVGHGLPVSELVQRMAASDVHLLLSDCGGWELTMLETAACGVANVIADAGAFTSYATPFSLTVPVIDRFQAGHRGEADVGDAVAAVARLLDDDDLRRQLGDAGRTVARQHDWTNVVDEWEATLR